MNADGTEETLLVENPDPLGYGEPAWTLRCRHAYGDVPAWVEDAVSWASCNRHMTGYPDNRFTPDDPMTRAQVARLLYRIAGTADTDSLPAHGFIDVPSWADDAITWLSAYDYANGYPDQTFRPRALITRAEYTRMQHRVNGSPTDAPSHPFTDVPLWVEEAVNWITDSDNEPPHATGHPDGTYRPGDAISRAEATRMACRILGTATC